MQRLNLSVTLSLLVIAHLGFSLFAEPFVRAIPRASSEIVEAYVVAALLTQASLLGIWAAWGSERQRCGLVLVGIWYTQLAARLYISRPSYLDRLIDCINPGMTLAVFLITCGVLGTLTLITKCQLRQGRNPTPIQRPKLRLRQFSLARLIELTVAVALLLALSRALILNSRQSYLLFRSQYSGFDLIPLAVSQLLIALPWVPLILRNQPFSKNLLVAGIYTLVVCCCEVAFFGYVTDGAHSNNGQRFLVLAVATFGYNAVIALIVASNLLLIRWSGYRWQRWNEPLCTQSNITS